MCVTVKTLGQCGSTHSSFASHLVRRATAVSFWSAVCHSQVCLVSCMALSTLWAQLPMHHSQPPSVLLTYPEGLPPQEFCFGNALPTPPAPYAQGPAIDCKLQSSRCAFPSNSCLDDLRSFSVLFPVSYEGCIMSSVLKIPAVLRVGLSFSSSV